MESSPVENRLSAIEARLQTIEKRLNVPASASIQPPPPQPSPDKLDKLDADDVWALYPDNAQKKTTGEPSAWQNLHSGNWLGTIAALCFVLAAGFIIKLSVESGWLTPARQIGLAVLLGFSLIGSGLALMKSDRAYAGYLPGAGIVTLFLSAFAAHRYYSLLSFEAAIAATSVVSVLCVWLYTKTRHDIYTMTAAAGAYIAPVSLGLNADNVFSLFYFLVCSTAFSTLAAWVESRTLLLIAAYLAIGMTSLIGGQSYYSDGELQQNSLVALVLGLHFLIFSVGTFLFSHHNKKPLKEDEAWYFLPLLLFFYAAEYYFIDRIHPAWAPWISLGFCGVLLSLYLVAKKHFVVGLSSQPVILAFISVVCFHSIYLQLLPEPFKPWLPSMIVLGAAFMPIALLNGKHDKTYAVPALLIFVILLIEYISLGRHLLDDHNLSALPACFAALASLWVAFVRFDDKFDNREMSVVILALAHVLAIMSFYRLTTEYGSLAVSASWLFYAVAIIALAFIRKDRIMIRSALFVLGLAAGKALLYDAASAPTILRIFCLLLTGGVLYGCGYFMRKTADWTRLDPYDSPRF